MLKIALDLKKDMKEYIKENLSKRNFNFTDNSSFGTIWIYDVSHIDFSGKSIEICQQGNSKFYDIYLEDIEYFEIHNQEK